MEMSRGGNYQQFDTFFLTNTYMKGEFATNLFQKKRD